MLLVGSRKIRRILLVTLSSRKFGSVGGGNSGFQFAGVCHFFSFTYRCVSLLARGGVFRGLLARTLELSEAYQSVGALAVAEEGAVIARELTEEPGLRYISKM